MVAKTAFSKHDFDTILSGYDLGEYVGFTLFENGTVQTNLLLRTSKGPYAFRCYENRSRDWALFEADLLSHLHKHDYPTPAPVPDLQGNFIGRYKNKPFAFFEFVDGSPMDDPNKRDNRNQCKEAVRHIARLHRLTADLKPLHYACREGRDKKTCLQTATSNAERITNPDLRQERLAWETNELKNIELPESLPHGICHADCNYSNFLFRDDALSGVLDFDMACHAYLIYDVANLIYWWAWPPGQNPDFKKIEFILSAYQEVRPLNQTEQEHIFDALKMVVMMSIAWFIFDDSDFESEKNRIDYLNQSGRKRFAERS